MVRRETPGCTGGCRAGLNLRGVLGNLNCSERWIGWTRANRRRIMRPRPAPLVTVMARTSPATFRVLLSLDPGKNLHVYIDTDVSTEL